MVNMNYMEMVNMNYQDQGFCGTVCTKPNGQRYKQSTTAALKQANQEMYAAIQNTPGDKRPEYRSLIRWEGDGYAWYWILR